MGLIDLSPEIKTMIAGIIFAIIVGFMFFIYFYHLYKKDIFALKKLPTIPNQIHPTKIKINQSDIIKLKAIKIINKDSHMYQSKNHPLNQKYIEDDLAIKIADKLLEQNLLVLKPSEDSSRITIEASLDIIKPKNQ